MLQMIHTNCFFLFWQIITKIAAANGVRLRRVRVLAKTLFYQLLLYQQWFVKDDVRYLSLISCLYWSLDCFSFYYFQSLFLSEKCNDGGERLTSVTWLQGSKATGGFYFNIKSQSCLSPSFFSSAPFQLSYSFCIPMLVHFSKLNSICNLIRLRIVSNALIKDFGIIYNMEKREYPIAGRFYPMYLRIFLSDNI